MHVRRHQDPRLNLEDTRLREPRKLSLLMGLVALAIAWAGRTAADRLGRRNPPRKAHGYYAKSWFRIGFDHIRHRLRTNPLGAIGPWFRIATQPDKVCGVVLCVSAALAHTLSKFRVFSVVQAELSNGQKWWFFVFLSA